MKRIFKMYNEIGVGTAPPCRACRAASPKLSKPWSPWVIGKDFAADDRRVLFVGKTARGALEGGDPSALFWDATEAGKRLFFEESWAYWSYTREIVQRVFGSAETGWDHIAFTNLIKCNDSISVDTTTDERAENCLGKLSVFQREVAIIRPARIVFFAGERFDEHLAALRFGTSIVDRTSQIHRVINGSKRLLWWHRDFLDGGKVVLRFLRVGHPERQRKASFVWRVARWITDS